MWQITDQLNWEAIRARFSWIKDMEGVLQDPIFHAEGDVAIHTQMVLEALLALEAFQALDTQEQQVLIAAALLHDVEKRSTTQVDKDGRISSPGHAKKGEYTARQILFRDMVTPFHLREQVAKLVRYHGLPLWLFEKRDPLQFLLKASVEVDTRLLAILARADVLGRVCDDQADLLYSLDSFEEYSKEQQCFGQAYPFPSALSRFTYFQQEGGGSPLYAPYDNTWEEVILLAGLPGMGKDTYTAKHFPGWPVVSLDHLRRKFNIAARDQKGNGQMIQLALEEARGYLRRQQPFVWNATNITQNNRSRLISLFSAYKAKVRIVYIEAPFATWQKQNLQRDYAVPLFVMDKMLKKLEIPSLAEAHEVTIAL